MNIRMFLIVLLVGRQWRLTHFHHKHPPCRPIDAPTAGTMTDHMLRYLQRVQNDDLPLEEQPVASELNPPRKLHWVLSPAIRTAQERQVNTTNHFCRCSFSSLGV